MKRSTRAGHTAMEIRRNAKEKKGTLSIIVSSSHGTLVSSPRLLNRSMGGMKIATTPTSSSSAMPSDTRSMRIVARAVVLDTPSRMFRK